ncbi:MAG: AAA family ATPase, partial [Rickettsiales bacterium]|nr:AAA family ATPase [Rickettsiales bacterium]
NTGITKANAVVEKYNCSVIFPVFKNEENEPTDWNDLHVLEGIEEVKKQLITAPNKMKILKAINVYDFLAANIKQKESIIFPIISSQSLNMLFAKRGIGKTYAGLSIAYAVASGSDLWLWKVEKPRKVLFVDGEMPAITIQERLAKISSYFNKDLPNEDFLKIINQDFQEKSIPDLCLKEGQEAIEQHLDGVELLILDNLSTLCRSGRENEAESWNPIQEWLLSLRKRNISVLIVHHSGKNGETSRGTSKREDILDTIIVLKRPKDYSAEQGARFEIHYDKSRNFSGKEAEPFEVILENNIWKTKTIEDSQLIQVLELSKSNLTQREIAFEMDISLATVNRLLKKAKGAKDGN